MLFDGAGLEVTGHVQTVSSKTLIVKVTEERKRQVTPKGPGLRLAVAMPKGERGDWLVEKCAELGAENIVPLRCSRGQVIPGDGKIERWRRKADEAARQSGQSTTTRVSPPCTLNDALDGAIARGPVFHGDPRCEALSLLQALHALHSDQAEVASVTIFIGPEGGFTAEEIREIETRGGRAVRVARSILRVETAAVAAAAAWAMFE